MQGAVAVDFGGYYGIFIEPLALYSAGDYVGCSFIANEPSTKK
jgi:hypothetical protein